MIFPLDFFISLHISVEMMLRRATNAYRNTVATGLINHRTSALGLNRSVFGVNRSFAIVASDNVPPSAPEQHRRRLPTAMERIRNFPAGVKQLYKDMLRYKNIHDASRTRLNAWTIRKPLSRRDDDDDGRLPFIIFDEELRPGRIPRREHDEQRRLKDDVRKVGPVVLLWILPIIGYLPMFFIILAPRQALSRQFYNRYEKELYASIEYRQSKNHFRALAEHVFGSVMVNVQSLDISVTGQDAAGPIVDLIPLYNVFSGEPADSSVVDSRLPRPARSKLAHLETYPREHLISLALANGLYQSFPDRLSRFFAFCCPWLRSEVRRIANLVGTDDKLLLEEAYDSNGCESLTDQEVLDACLMRGLPVTVSYAEMRQCLTNHLTMIRALRESLPKTHTTSEGLKLFTLHLSALRYHLREEAGL